MRQETALVYEQATDTGGRLLHQPGPTPGTPYTACGLDAADMAYVYRPTNWAGAWCTACLARAKP